MTGITNALSQEIEYRGEDPSRAHARANLHNGPETPPATGTRIFPRGSQGRAAKHLTPGPSRRATLWAWACRSCGEISMLWSKARPVKCYSGCDSYGFRIVMKQYPNESEEAFLARFTGREVTV